MLRKLKQAAYSFFLSKIILLATVGRAFANDSQWADKMDHPFWETYWAAFQKFLTLAWEVSSTVLTYMFYASMVILAIVVLYAAYYFYHQWKYRKA